MTNCGADAHVRARPPGRAIAFAILALTVPLSAQTTGAIDGTAYDSTGATLAGAAIRIVETQTNSERTLLTDIRGHYHAPGLAPGMYDVEASFAHLQTEMRRGIDLSAGRTLDVDFRLRVGETHETLVVEGDASPVSLDAADWSASVEKKKVDSLPLNGRDLFELAAQEPGASITYTATQSLNAGLGLHISVNGARPTQNSFRMDGMYFTDATGAAPSGSTGRLLGVEAVQEVHLVTSPFAAEFGRAAGAVFTAVSKSGSNALHGSLYEYLRNSALDTKNFFDPAAGKVPPLRRNQFGGLIGGPIRHDRLFYLLNYEGIRQASSIASSAQTLTADARRGILPGPGGTSTTVPVSQAVLPYLNLYPLPNGRDFGGGTAEYLTNTVTHAREDYGVGKIDAIKSERFRSSVRYTVDDSISNFPDPFLIWQFLNHSNYYVIHTETQFLQSPRTIHSVRAGFSRIANSATYTLPSDIPSSLSFIPGQQLGTMSVVGLTDLGGLTARLRPQQLVTNDYQANYSLDLIRGAHRIRAGAGYDRVQFNQLADNGAAGNYRFTSVSSFLQARPASGDLMLPGSDSARGWRQSQFFLFAQDEFRPVTRLSLLFGVRYEPYTVPNEVNGKIATLRNPLTDAATHIGGPVFTNPSADNFAPRAALAWDVTGAGTTVVRAGAGIFYDLLGARQLVIAGDRVPPFFNRLAPASPQFPALLASIANARPQNSIDGFDYYALQPYVAQFQFAVERKLGEGVAQISYAGSRGVHLDGRLVDANPNTPTVLPNGQLFFPQPVQRLNPAFGQIGMRRTQFDSVYESLNLSYHRRWRNNFRFQAKYTWAKSIDDTSTSIFLDYANSSTIGNIFDYRANRGLSDFDFRHVFALNFDWRLPGWHSTAFARALADWELLGLVQVQTGYPFAPAVGFDRGNLGAATSTTDLGQRPNLIAGVPQIFGDPQQWFNPLAFSLPAAGTLGNLGRGTLTGPGLVVANAAIHKRVWQTDRQSIHLRLEVFNIANHPNFQVPSNLALFDSTLQRVATAGRITSTTTTSRQIQIAAKWSF